MSQETFLLSCLKKLIRVLKKLSDGALKRVVVVVDRLPENMLDVDGAVEGEENVPEVEVASVLLVWIQREGFKAKEKGSVRGGGSRWRRSRGGGGGDSGPVGDKGVPRTDPPDRLRAPAERDLDLLSVLHSPGIQINSDGNAKVGSGNGAGGMSVSGMMDRPPLLPQNRQGP